MTYSLLNYIIQTHLKTFYQHWNSWSLSHEIRSTCNEDKGKRQKLALSNKKLPPRRQTQPRSPPGSKHSPRRLWQSRMSACTKMWLFLSLAAECLSLLLQKVGDRDTACMRCFCCQHKIWCLQWAFFWGEEDVSFSLSQQPPHPSWLLLICQEGWHCST